MEFFSNDTVYLGNTASLYGDAIASTYPVSVDLNANTFDSNGLRDPQVKYHTTTHNNLVQPMTKKHHPKHTHL